MWPTRLWAIALWNAELWERPAGVVPPTPTVRQPRFEYPSSTNVYDVDWNAKAGTGHEGGEKHLETVHSRTKPGKPKRKPKLAPAIAMYEQQQREEEELLCLLL